MIFWWSLAWDFWRVTNSSDQRRVWTANLLHAMQVLKPLRHKAQLVKKLFWWWHIRDFLKILNSSDMQCLNCKLIHSINPFHASISFLYPLKTSGNLWFSDVFKGYRNGTLTWKGLGCIALSISLLLIYFVYERLVVQTLPWSLEFVILEKYLRRYHQSFDICQVKF